VPLHGTARRRGVAFEQRRLRGRVVPRRPHQRFHAPGRDAVHHHRRTPGVTRRVERFGEQARRERQERGDQQHQDVQPHQVRIDVAQVREQPVVREPDAADREEARDVREVRRPLLADGPPQVVEVLRLDVDLEHEQRDRDREHAVAERLDAPGGPAELGRRRGHGAPRSPMSG